MGAAGSLTGSALVSSAAAVSVVSAAGVDSAGLDSVVSAAGAVTSAAASAAGATGSAATTGFCSSVDMVMIVWMRNGLVAVKLKKKIQEVKSRVLELRGRLQRSRN